MADLFGEISTVQSLEGQINLGGTAPTLVEKSITANGTYNASADNADGYSKVVVSVDGGGGSSVSIDGEILVFSSGATVNNEVLEVN